MGLALAAAWPQVHLTLTDVDRMLSLLQRNVFCNTSTIQQSRVIVKQLQWQTNFVVPTSSPLWQLVLICDCIYYEEGVDALLDTVTALCCHGGPDCRVVLCFEDRSEYEDKRLIQQRFFKESAASPRNLRWKAVEPQDLHEDYCCPDIHLLIGWRETSTVACVSIPI